MKENLEPSLVEQLNDHVLLWFKKSNQYIVLDPNLYLLVKVFLSSEGNKSFIISLKEMGYKPSEADKLFIEIQAFLQASNEVSLPETVSKIKFSHNNTKFSHRYELGQLIISVNYGSENIRNLVHPHIEHLEIPFIQGERLTTFDLYQDEDQLCFFKNKKPIGCWPLKDYHLLQGKFAMNLLCTLHDNEESDWLGTFHASTVVKNNQSVMIIGDSGSGKSTFTALLLANGFEILADDLTPVFAKDTFVYPYPGGISIKSGAFDLLNSRLPNFSELPEHYINPYKGYVKYVAAPKSKSYTTGYPCKKMVRINYKDDSETKLETISIAQALETLIPESWLAHNTINAQQFLNWIKNVKFYELTYSNSDEAIKVFSQLIKE